jgi:hypothetical protein
MADRTLVKNYLREAAANAEEPKGTTEQLAWLELQRVALSVEVNAGDFEITANAFEGGSASGKRGLNAKDRLAAVLAAMEQLEDATTGGGMLIIPIIHGVED